MIGILDSGVGGLSTAREISDRLPGHDIVYFGDTARFPYGTKSREALIDFAAEGAGFLEARGAKVLVIACSTLSSVAGDRMSGRTDLPVIGAVGPAVELALRESKRRRIGVIGTPSAMAAGTHERILRDRRPEVAVFTAACPLLVPLVEAGWIGKPETARVVKKCVHPLKTRQIDTLILACTHYRPLRKTLQTKAGRRVALIDPATAVAGALQAFLQTRPELAEPPDRNGTARFFLSDLTKEIDGTARRFYGKQLKLEQLPGF